MASKLSIEELKSKLKNLFCEENKTSHKYSEVWLSDVDFGGLYQTDKVVVNVKAEHEILSCNNEIKYIVAHLFGQLPVEERSMIWRVKVYNASEQMHCESDDILVYTEADACV